MNSKTNKDARVGTISARHSIRALARSQLPDYLAGLNPKQLQAVRYGIKPGDAKHVGPLLIIAGAGTGKTTTITARAAHLIVNGIKPDRILLLTFTRRAAADMKSRVRDFAAQVLNGAKLDLPWAGTFHSIGARLLRKHGRVIGLKPSFTIMDQSDSADLMNLVRQELGLSKMEKRFPEKATCLAIYSHMINSRKPLEKILAKHFPWCAEWQRELRSLFRQFVQAKLRQNILDYDDLLLFWDKMMHDKSWQWRLAAASMISW